MPPLPPMGHEIGDLPVELRRVRVIEHFEGERLVEYRSGANDPYFKIWLDTDGEHVTRWIVLRLTDRDVALFLHMDMSLRDVILGARDGHVYIVDKIGAEVRRVAFVRPHQIPGEHLPLADSYYDSTLAPRCSPADAPPEQDILLDGEWDPEGLAALEKRYGQVYAFNSLFAMGSARDIGGMRGRFANTVFAGAGWSHVNAVDSLVASVPREEKPAFESVQLSSPGIMKYRVDAVPADRVRSVMRLFRERGGELDGKYSTLHEKLKEINRSARWQAEELSADKEEYDRKVLSILCVPNPPIRGAAVSLAESLGVDHERILFVGGHDINSGELIAGYYRRALDLFTNESSGQAIVV